MTIEAYRKYKPFQPVGLSDRQWPSRVIRRAPIWCSVDLRDGNQALVEPMNAERKHRMFRMLVSMGYKQIEVGFPSASQTDFDFVRELIEQDLVPDDVVIQVLTQAREPLIRRTFESLRGAKRAIVHVYNATAPVFRRVVFDVDRAGAVEIAVNATRLIREIAESRPETDWGFEYSPETFSATELDFALEISDAVADVWEPTPERKMILNLPTTVEVATPNIFADQVEWMHRNLVRRDSIVLSVHPHNDRGTGVASAELALMAGADRVEGTLFGNGERTGNVDLVTLALNLHTQGVDPEVDISDINEVIRCAEYCNQLPVHPRHPYAGELVFTAFSGSHQDAIKKGFAARQADPEGAWEVPYLPIDPADVGRSYEAVIRVNSQSGKGGIAYLLERDYGLDLPKRMQVEFSRVVQDVADTSGKELTADEIWSVFEREYFICQEPFDLVEYRDAPDPADSESDRLSATVRFRDMEHLVTGQGNGPIDAFVDALRKQFGVELDLNDYREHASGSGASAMAAAYVEISGADGAPVFGIGRHANIVTASLRAVLSAVNRAEARGALEWVEAECRSAR